VKLVFRKSSHHLQSLADNDGQISSLKVFGQPLIVRNASVASKVLNIDKIMTFPVLVSNNFKMMETALKHCLRLKIK